MEFDGDAVVRLVVALVLGAVIGAEREVADQPAGLRTHIAVSLGAALFGVISTLGFEEFFARRETTNVQVDVTRVASQVVVGIGFIGAGMIFRQGGVVRNLTTAASLWATSAIGLAVGVGNIVTAAVATFVLLVSLALLRPLRTWLRDRVARDVLEARIVLENGVDPDGLLEGLNRLEGVHVEHVALEKSAGNFVVLVRLRSDPHVDVSERFSAIARRSDVLSAGEQVAEGT